MDTTDWEQPDPADLLLLGSDADWEALVQRYEGINDRPLRRCLEVARSNGATTVVIETRYIDLDYRSEFSAFFSKTFAAQPDTAHRLHFFKAPLKVEQLWRLPDNHGYLGYVVFRPSELGAVGRSVLAPPPGLTEAVRTSVKETVHFFGAPLTVSGVPFVQQDTQLGRCAHAAAWVCHYTAARRGEVARRPMADFSLSAEPGLGWGRPLPSEGLTVQQLLELLRIFDLPPAFYSVDSLDYDLPWGQPAPTWPGKPTPEHPGYWDTRLISVCCRYLNSGFPVLVGTADHAFTLCGYEREPRKGQPDWIRFIRHDDQRGPYLPVDDVFSDIDKASGYQYTPWDSIIVPLPDKLWLPPEPVEYAASEFLESFATLVEPHIPDAGRIRKMIKEKDLSLHTYARTANAFKAQIDRGLDPTIQREYRLARFSRYIWVVEAVSRKLRKAGKDCVLGEIIFDATSSETSPRPLAMHVPGVALVERTEGPARFPIRCSPDPYRTGGIGPP